MSHSKFLMLFAAALALTGCGGEEQSASAGTTRTN